jgi:uncharacterized protein YdhG (YjbR/CyaY superfamily)
MPAAASDGSGSETNPIEAHLSTLPQPQRDTLTALHRTLRKVLPDAEECISYNMPCFKVDGIAVAGFDGYKRHCSYFPHSGNVVTAVSGIPDWCTVASKGTLQFPVDRALPEDVVRSLVDTRLAEIAAHTSKRRRR